MKKVIHKNKTIAEIYPYLDLEKYTCKTYTPLDLSGCLAQIIPASATGYAGFQTKRYLRNSLLFHAFGTQKELNTYDFSPLKDSAKGILSRMGEALKKACKCLPSKARTKIYVFPTSQSFTREKMFGVDGFTPYRNTVNIYVHPKPKDKKLFFQEIKWTIAHEYNHAVRSQFFPISHASTLLDALVDEGLAENFRMQTIGGKISPWAGSLQRKKAEKVFQKIKPLLQSTSYKIYREVFFADKKYSLWAGYAIGYQIVKSFLQKLPVVRWTEIIKFPSQEILKRSEF